MTEVIPETPMKIPEEEIKVEDVSEHLIKILDISEQNVNIMKERMAGHLQIFGSLYRDPDGRMDKYEPYINTEGKQTFLPQYVASNLSLLSHWDREFTSSHQMSTQMVAWINLTKEEFQQWKINPEVGQTIINFNTPKKTSSFKTPSTRSSLMSNESYQELMAFKKAAKRDISAFEILKDEKYYDVFHRSFKATAMTQGLLDVCNPTFKPKRGDPHGQQPLTEKQNFVYAVLLKTLQTDHGRALVQEHEHDRDAQQILYELHQHHIDSELSRAEVLRLTTYVANLKLTDNWRGTTTQFLLHFKEQLRLLDTYG